MRTPRRAALAAALALLTAPAVATATTNPPAEPVAAAAPDGPAAASPTAPGRPAPAAGAPATPSASPTVPGRPAATPGDPPTAPAPADPGGGPATAARPLGWTLAGVSANGRRLLVRPATYGGCDQGPPVITVTQTAAAVTLAVTVRSPTDPNVVCPAIARIAAIQSVPLSAPIAGRPIGGPERTTRPGAAYLDAVDESPGLPRVVGLRASDARSVLCAWGLRARPGAGRGTVTAQSPPPGRPLAQRTTPLPERCAGLRATVTLQTR